MITPDVMGEMVNRHALANNLRPDIVMCVVIQESNVNPFANRMETALLNKLNPMDRNQLSGWQPVVGQLPSLNTEKANRAQSWGLMQVLGETARWCAQVKLPYLSALCDPELGLDAGCRTLSFYLGKANSNYTDALSMYNSGLAAAKSTMGAAYAQSVLGRLQRGEHLQYVKPH